MEWILIGIGIGCVLLPVKWDPAFWAVRKRNKKILDPYIARAKIDQKNADYPGCQLGLMACRSTSCGCNEGRASSAFVLERAKYLLEHGIPDES